MALKKRTYQALIADIVLVADELNELKIRLIELAFDTSDLMEAAHPKLKVANKPRLVPAPDKILPMSGSPMRGKKKNPEKGKKISKNNKNKKK